MTRVYVAAPFEDASKVREVHEFLRASGITPTSRWAEGIAMGAFDNAKDAASLPDTMRKFAEQNDRDIESSSVVFVMAREGAGAEMFAEARFALTLGKPVIWWGRPALSAWRSGVVRAKDFGDAMA